KFPPPSRKVQVDVRLDEIVLRALENDPERRYQQASEVKTDVETISGSPAQQPASPEPTPSRPAYSSTGPGWDADAARRLQDLERRRKALLWYGFIVSIFGIPMGFALDLPLVWGLGILGIAVGGTKLGLWKRLSKRLTPRPPGTRPVTDPTPPIPGNHPGTSAAAGPGITPPRDATATHAPPDNERQSKGNACPWFLWIALVVLLLTFFAKVALGPRDNPWVLADLLLLLGLRLRLKAAWVATLFFAVFGVFWAFWALASGPSWSLAPHGNFALTALGVLAINALVAVPVWLSASWFFPGPAHEFPWRIADALRGLIFLLPPMLFTSALVGNVLNLDIDVRFFVALLGLPVATGLGAAAVWASTLIYPSATPTNGPHMPWSWRAIVSAGLLVLCLPLAATSLLTIQAIAADPDWNPAPQEAAFAFGIIGGATLLALGSLILGLMGRKACQNPGAPRRGGRLAWAGIWFWPALLTAAFTMKPQRVEGRDLLTTAEARVAEAVLETEITARAAELGWRLDDLAVQVSGLPPSASCHLGHGIPDGGTIPVPVIAGVRITPGGPGRWQVHGQ
ncbi:MAG: hypothetical protein KDM81_15275, partial [Verrucomicrobiae bacterium]|nr:hypothetical protein [Verrucomicrobiae bacterium]